MTQFWELPQQSGREGRGSRNPSVSSLESRKGPFVARVGREGREAGAAMYVWVIPRFLWFSICPSPRILSNEDFFFLLFIFLF